MVTSSMRPFTVWSYKLSIILFLLSMRGQYGFLVGTAPREMHGIEKKFMAMHHARPELSCFSSYSNRKNILPMTRDVSFVLHNRAGDQITSLPTSRRWQKDTAGNIWENFRASGKDFEKCQNNSLVNLLKQFSRKSLGGESNLADAHN
jgi:hypothetical protein